MAEPDPVDAADPRPAGLRIVVTLVAAALPVLGGVWVMDVPARLGLVVFTEQMLAIMLGLAIALVFLNVAADRGKRDRLPWYDAIAAAVGLATLSHVANDYPRLMVEVSSRSTETLIIGAVVVVLVLEGLRRTTGYTLLTIVILFVFYALVADRIPGALQGQGIEPDKLLIYLALDTNAALSIPMSVGSTVVLMFILMGQLLFATGGGQCFTDIAMALMGRRRGGAAKVAVVASAMFGSISGTAVSNVASTGIVTIPLMQRSGYRAAQAGAIEAVASTGGQIMPPIMGAAAFLMAELIEISYTDVLVAAVVPALLYYLAVFVQVDLIAAREKIAVVDRDFPSIWEVLRGGWHFLLPFAVLLYALFELLVEPEVAALYAAAAIVIAGPLLGYRGRRPPLKDIVAALPRTGLVMIELFMILGAAGFVIGILNVTGLSFALTLLLVQLGGDSLIVLLVISAGVCILLGMGMPTLGVYILLATLVAPAIVEAGVPDLSAHMFIFYFGMMSMITPPVALAAFAAATIARSDPMDTGWLAMKLGWVAYVVPFLFVASPPMLMIGDSVSVVVSFVEATIGVFYVTVALVGYFARPLGAAIRIVAALAGLALFAATAMPWIVSLGVGAAGAALGALVLAFSARAGRR